MKKNVQAATAKSKQSSSQPQQQTPDPSPPGIDVPDADSSGRSQPQQAQQPQQTQQTQQQTPQLTGQTSEEQQAIQNARDNLGITAIERTLNNLVQELQAQRSLMPVQNGQPRSIWGSIEAIINAVAVGISKIPSGSSTESNLAARLLDMTLNHYATIDAVFLKTVGLPVPPVVQHMKVVE